MASFNIRFKSSSGKDLRKLSRIILSRVIKQIEDLRSEPFKRQAIKLSNAEQLYRIRVGEYRIVYEVDVQTKEVIIHHVRHRRDVYRAL